MTATWCAWAADETVLDEAKRKTHHELVEMLGSRRRGPVEWRVYAMPAASTALHILSDQHGDDDLGLARDLLNEYGGLLVVASCEESDS